jgi:hypothetical protein
VARLLVHVEGETEESFVNEVLSGHLRAFGYTQVSARLLGNARQRSRRGGIRAWAAVKGDITRHLREDRNCIATTLVDYYALPQTGEKAWPGRADAAVLPGPQKATKIEAELLDDVAASMGPDFSRGRFVPFVVMHEFEAWLFSDCHAFEEGIGRQDLVPAFHEIRAQFATPEDINDSPVTAPSKRVAALISGYQKPIYGNIAVLSVGLQKIRVECPHFHDWLIRLEALGRQ